MRISQRIISLERKLLMNDRKEPLFISMDNDENLFFNGEKREKPKEITVEEFRRIYSTELRNRFPNRFINVDCFIPLPSMDGLK